MIRYAYIYNQILQIYNRLESIRFPLEPDIIISSIHNCKSLTYRELAAINNCSVYDVIMLCESKSGCTHYDVTNDRYLLLWNADNSDNNVDGRKRWTKAHEVGHVVLNHLPLIAEPSIAKLAENSFNNLSTPEFEAEADHFAATLLCPMPLYKLLNVESPMDVQKVFGLSVEASMHRWTAYTKWINYHHKTAWENDIKRIFLERRVII